MLSGSTLVLTGANVAVEFSNYSGSVVSGAVIAVQVDSANAGIAAGAVLEDHKISGGPYHKNIVIGVE